MGKLKGLNIVFDKEPVFAGQVLNGQLSFSTKDFVNVKSVLVCFEGSSKTGWSGDGSAGHGNEQWYFRVEIPLTGFLMRFGDLGGKHPVPPGDHYIPFTFPIPSNVPNTFSSKLGRVHYCCKAHIALTGSDMKCEKAIHVVGVEDLNWHPYAGIPLSYHEGYNQRFCCFKLANVTAVLQIPRSGFIPGEVIEISAEIANRSTKRKVKRTTIQLMQTAHYKSGCKTKQVQTVVAQLTYGEIPPGSVQKLEEEPMEVPPIPPSFLRGCEDIQIRYDLLFVVEPGIRFSVPILIGTVPFRPESLKKFAKALPWKGAQEAAEVPVVVPEMSTKPTPPIFAARSVPLVQSDPRYGAGGGGRIPAAFHPAAAKMAHGYQFQKGMVPPIPVQFQKGMVPPSPMQFHQGMVPPPHMQFPKGMVPPSPMQFQNGMVPPASMQFQQGMVPPSPMQFQKGSISSSPLHIFHLGSRRARVPERPYVVTPSEIGDSDEIYGGSVISKRRPNDSSQPHVLKIEEIE